jgi:hypothetical protein
MRIFKTRAFARLVRKTDIDDAALIEAVARAEKGLVDAELGSGLVKQRVARKGQGKSGGYRSLIAFRMDDWAIFLYAFAKNDRGNIAAHELQTLRILAADFLAYGPAQIEKLMQAGELMEVT